MEAARRTKGVVGAKKNRGSSQRPVLLRESPIILDVWSRQLRREAMNVMEARISAPKRGERRHETRTVADEAHKNAAQAAVGVVQGS